MNTLFGMSLTETLIVISLFLILLDVFFASDIPTHIAYVLTTINIVKEIDLPFLYLATIAIVTWFVLIAFHYFFWRNVIEKINDKFISPRRHESGMDALVGKVGTVISIEEELFITVNEELFKFHALDGKIKTPGKSYIIKKVEDNTLFI
jgi:membrane protein implicated in regulation of membrane protease activity